MFSEILNANLFAALLVFARVGTMLMVLPIFGEQYVLSRLRLALAVFMTAIIMPEVSASLPASPAHPLQLIPIVGSEILIGLAVAGIGRLIVGALHIAGTIVAIQSGLSSVQTIDPSQGLQSVVPANFVIMTGTTFLIVSNLHYPLIRAIARSYTLFPPGGALPIGDFAALASKTVVDAFSLGIQLSAPFLVYGIVFNVLMGLINRLMPAVQVFFIAMPIQVLLSFFLFAVTIGLTITMFADRFVAAFGPLIP